MRIQNNIMAMNTHRQLGVNNLNQTKSTEKLSSGYRINRAADDASGLSISEKMRAQVRGLNQASANAQDGISLVQAAEGALQETHSILQRMRELSVKAANDVNQDEDRNAIKAELDQLTSEIDRIATTTNFNKRTLLDGSLADDGLKLQVGANAGSDQTIEVKIAQLDAEGLEIDSLDVSDNEKAQASITSLDAAIQTVSNQRSELGAVQNRLEHTVANLDTVSENLQAAESRIRDVDMAKEMMAFTKNNILSQAATAMLAQANQAPQTVLQLLQ
ncbi:MAG: flagellin [Oscillospiraceae bacterium]|nr:flagellin [Oscillospiraceae bacterium]